LDDQSIHNLLSLFTVNPLEASSYFGLALIGVLLIFSAAISGSEVAFFSLSPKDVELLQAGDSERDTRVLTLLTRPKKLLATILIANNGINIGIVLLSTLTVNAWLTFESPLIGFIIQVGAVTFIILLIGEVLPKVYSSTNALKVSKIMSKSVGILLNIFSPLSSILINSTDYIERKLGNKRNSNVSVDELEQALELTYQSGHSNQEEQKILKGIVKFGNTEASQIMTARMDVLAVDTKTDYKDLYQLILDSGYSRIPVFEESFDNVCGVLYIKDLLEHLDDENPNWQALLRAPYYVPENKKIVDLMSEFQSRKIHLAIVVDEYGGSSGIVTLEDIIEEIVGEISDEFDDPDIAYTKIDAKNYVFEGKTLLVDLYKILNIDSEIFEAMRGDSGTIAGFLLEQMGRIPQKNERYSFDNYTFTVEAADTRKVKRVKITLK